MLTDASQSGLSAVLGQKGRPLTTSLFGLVSRNKMDGWLKDFNITFA